RARVDQAEHEKQERAAIAELERRAAALGLLLPTGFVGFARDFRRRSELESSASYCELCIQAAVFAEFRQWGDGYLIDFFGDMNYGKPDQRTWGLHIVPGVAWHCVVVSEVNDEAVDLWPEYPEHIFYCAPSFQAFLYRWWLAGDRRS